MSENSEAYKKYKKYKLKYKLKSKEYKMKSKDSKLYQSMVMKGGAETASQIKRCTETNNGFECFRRVKDGVVQKYRGTLRSSGYSCLPNIYSTNIDSANLSIQAIMNFKSEEVQNGIIKGTCQKKVPDREAVWTTYLHFDARRYQIVSYLLINNLNSVATTFIQNQEKLFQPGTSLDETNFFIQKLRLPSDSKIAVVGDLHGGFQDLMVFIKSIHKLGFFDDNYNLKENHYIFSLGDMVDRGPSSLQVVFFLLLLKNENSKRVFIVNGNHERSMTYQHYGQDWLGTVANLGNIDNTVYENATFKPFWYLPRAIFVQFEGMNKWIQFCHGGLDGYNEYSNDNRKGLHDDSEIKEFLISSDLIKTFNQETYQKDGLRWSDFGIKRNIDQYDWRPSTRGRTNNLYEPGVGNLYGISSTDDLLQKNNLECIIRGHQDKVTGFALLPTNPTGQATPTDCESAPFTVGSPEPDLNTIQTHIYMNVKHDNIETLRGVTPTSFSKLVADNTYNGERKALLCSIAGKTDFIKSDTPAKKVELNSTHFNVLTTSNCKQARRPVKLDNSFVIVTKSNVSS